MGCTPSIQMPGGRVISCRDADDSPTSTGSSGNIAEATKGGATQVNKKTSKSKKKTKTDSRILNTANNSGSGGKGDPVLQQPALVSLPGTVMDSVIPVKDTTEAETQTSSKVSTPQVDTKEVRFGTMRVKVPPMKILLAFHQEDSQSDGLWWAAERCGFPCQVARSVESALEAYRSKDYDLVIVDCRGKNRQEGEGLCRTIRAAKDSQYAYLLAVVSKSSDDSEEEVSVQPFLNAGFDRWYLENPDVTTCVNELLQIEVSGVRVRHQVRAAATLFTALDGCKDAVEITNEENEIEYINHACEKLLGYTSDELLGKKIQEVVINTQVNKGKAWEGTIYTKRKHGESIPLVCHVFPVSTQGKKPDHYVYVKEFPLFWDKPSDYIIGKDTSHISALDIYTPYNNIRTFRKGSCDAKSLKGDGMNRRQSFAKYAMMIEAPITKVINLITAAQENSPLYVSQALDKVLDILRQSELYSPQVLGQTRVDDPVANDLIGGLLAQGPKPPLNARRFSNESQFVKGSQIHHQLPRPTSPLVTFSSLSTIPPTIKAILASEDKWDFDIIELEKASNKRPLLWLGMTTFSRFNVAGTLSCSEATLQNWFTVIEANYHSENSYHNSTHAADVMQCTAYFLQKERFKEILDPMEEAACLIAAVVHDIDHPGKNNAFLCNSSSELAILYNDLAVLESHHAAMAFKLTTADDRVNIFRNLEKDVYRALRQNIIDMVLATEMTKHFEHLAKFVNVFTKPVNREDQDSAGPTTSTAEPIRESPDLAIVATHENMVLVKRMLIKCADVSNPVRPLKSCIEWAYRIAEEYFSQTEEEKTRSLPVVMPMFDRNTCSIPKSQMGFIDYFIMDMFDAWDAFLDCPELLEHLRRNYEHWKDQEQQNQSQGGGISRRGSVDFRRSSMDEEAADEDDVGSEQGGTGP